MGALLDLALKAPAEAGSPVRVASEGIIDIRRQQRVDQAVEMLRAVPTRHSAFIAGDVEGDVIPVTVVIRRAQGLITGEMEIPRDRWDPVLFLQFLREQDERELA